jgi:hypothetical protein
VKVMPSAERDPINVEEPNVGAVAAAVFVRNDVEVVVSVVGWSISDVA